jgi:regulatory protein
MPVHDRRGSRRAGGSLEEAKALVLRVLACHARSEAQLRARLVRDGHAEHADAVIAWLGRCGYLDDGAYARGRARSLLARVGPRMAERRLRAAGIEAGLARAVVATAAEERAAELASEGPAEVILCRAALRARLPGGEPGSLDDRARSRLARFLLGRGFSGAAVSRVLGLRLDVDT